MSCDERHLNQESNWHDWWAARWTYDWLVAKSESLKVDVSDTPEQCGLFCHKADRWGVNCWCMVPSATDLEEDIAVEKLAEIGC